MSAVFTRVEDRGFVFPVYHVTDDGRGTDTDDFRPGWYYYDEELAESYERDGDYCSAYCGPYPTRDAVAKAAYATYQLYQSL